VVATMRFLLPIFIACSVPACAGEDDPGPGAPTGAEGEGEGGGEGASQGPRQVMPVPAEPDFVLFVSNQSFDLDPVDIQVFVDDELAVEGDFLVESQHSWHMFELELTPGPHTIRAVSEAGETERVDSIELPEQVRYAVINFWFYEAGSPEPYGPTFSFDLFEEPPGFD
jgi:hypothetical protein